MVGILGLVLVWLFIPDVEKQDPGPLDRCGLLLWGGALALLMAGLETVVRGIAPAWFAPTMLGLGAVAMVPGSIALELAMLAT